MLAVENGDVGHVNIFAQEGGANVNAVRLDVKTMAVVITRQNGMEKAVSLLKELGAVCLGFDDDYYIIIILHLRCMQFKTMCYD